MKRIFLMLILVSSACVIVRAQDLKPALNYTVAQKILLGSIAYADSAKVNMVIAIYDNDAQLMSFARMNGASIGVSKVAQWKGVSAALYQTSTAQTATWNANNAPDIATIPGGVPIFTKDGNFIGSVGVSGAASSVDVKCAEAGLRAAGLSSVKK
jgi:glc operon protein GlcG